MLQDLNKYNNLGTPAYYYSLFTTLNTGNITTENAVKKHFFNRTIDKNNIFDGCLPLLKLANIITIEDESNRIIIQYEYQNLWRSEKLCKNKLLEGFLHLFKKDEEFHKIFLESHFDYLQYKAVTINASSFKLKHTKIKRLLLDFEFLQPHPDMPYIFLINAQWKNFFDTNITPYVRKLLSIEDLKKKLEQQNTNGEEAERFILEFENQRLNNKNGIEWIAPYDATAGFDILSFHNIHEDSNRYIEVKSYIGEIPYFYWTKNEMNKSKEYLDNYFLYLVDRSKINQVNYNPIIIQNPYEEVLKNEQFWEKTVDKYYIKYREFN